jgi:ArsR family transcriptional regulator, arsenate/arsenite/antimonite-responsive transcriptional repressor
MGRALFRSTSYLPSNQQFDSHKTMNPPRSSALLAPGQFERIAKALADPRRFAMLETISSALECPNQALCDGFPVSKATVSHHIKELVQAGLIEPEREGQYKSYRVRDDIVNAYAAEVIRRVGKQRSRAG